MSKISHLTINHGELDSRLLSAEDIETLRALITRYRFVLLYADEKRVYLLLYHWRYLNPFADAERVLLFPNRKLKEASYYITEI